MSEGTTSSAPPSETAQPESTAAPAGAPKKKLWLMIAVIAVVAILIGSSVYVMFLAPMRASMDPDDVTLEAGQLVSLSVSVKKGVKTVTDSADAKYRWRLDPDTLASFNLKSKPNVNLTAGKVAGSGTLSCEITYKGETKTLTKPITVKPPFLDQITVTPSTKTIDKGMTARFTASAVDSVADPIPNLTYTWAVSGAVSATLDVSTGLSVNLTAGNVYGNVTLTATATSTDITKSGSAAVTIGPLPPRSVDYLWYDMFNVPFGQWWTTRWNTYHIEEPITDSNPYLFRWHGKPEGNNYIYTNLRLNITGRNMSELNMNEHPEFLPLHGTARGGTAEIDWYLQYLTSDEMKRYPAATAAWDDGWVVSLNGTVTLDKQASTAVLKGMTNSAFENFTTWWLAHGTEVTNDLTSWIVQEAGPTARNEATGAIRTDMDIYPMYDGNYQMLTGSITAAKVGDKIVLTYDLVTWGIESLMARWLHEAFMPNEWYFEDMDFHATIGPERADVDIDTVVVYGVYAYEVTNTPPSGPETCWVWESLLQDYVPSSPPEHPYSGYDQYEPFSYLNTAPGSDWYGKNMTYDYEPYATNVSVNETVKFVWPGGLQQFKVHVPWNESASHLNETGTRNDTMVVKYSEPMDTDNSDVAPGSITIDNVARFIEFKGPIDMWDWSKNQNALNHQWLRGEWDRMGILPYGAPYIEFWPEHSYTPTIDHFVITDVPERPVNNTAVGITVTAYDEVGRLFVGYDGTVTFSSNRTDVVLPGDYTFSPSENGRHTFDNLTFTGEGYFWVNVSAVERPEAKGSFNDLWVIPVPEIITLEVEVLGVKGIVVKGLPTSVKVTAYNQYPAPHNLVKDYNGTINFTTDAPAGTYELPPNATFSPENSGIIVVHGLLYNESGTYTLTVVDVANASITTSVTVVVSVPPDIKYRIYDMLEQPWGDWWPWRLTGYKTDIILNNQPHAYTMVYNPDTRNQQGVIYAPYRWNMTATNMTTLNVHSPEFMPVLGTPDVAGASADMHIWFQYLDNATWNGYWKPTWGTNPNWSATMDAYMPPDGISGQFADGYYLGVLYTVSMNREAALEWLGMPVSGDPATWWTANGASYMEQWQRWVIYEGKFRLDIWPAYEFDYRDMGTMMDFVEEPTGAVTLRIAHFSWGYEALITRWLNETALCTHEPYMEDFNLSAHFANEYANVTFDAVAQYNLHSTMQNGTNGTTNGAAWVWEPQRIDYVWYENAVSGYVSEFNPWDAMMYTSWNAGDGFFGDYAAYDFTPTFFNLTSYMTLEIQLRTDAVLGYMGEKLTTGRTFGAIYELKRGNRSAYDNITIHGEMTLGYNMTGEGPGAPNLWDYYDPVAKKLTITGPLNFDNYRFPNGLLYHSAPWIEFNVANETPGPLPLSTTVTTAAGTPAVGASMSGDSAISELAALAVVLSGIVMTVAVIAENIRRKE